MTTPRPSAPPAVRWIVRTLEAAGYETWAVGGAIRDVFLGLPAGDWDLATRARPEEMRRVFRRTVPIGVEHGTVGVLTDEGAMVEVTTFRRDVDTDGRHAVVEFSDDVVEDLARRDFTINAVAWHPLREELLDPWGGVGDLERRILRAVGDPANRFAEDHLRVLRALRFAGRFALAVAPETWTAVCAGVEHLPSLSAERVREELLKVLDADPAPSGALGLYRRCGALAVLYGEVAAWAAAHEDAWAGTLRTIDRLPRGRPSLRLAALLRGLEARHAAPVLVRLRLSNAQTDATARLAAAPSIPGTGAADSEVRRWLSEVGPGLLGSVARLDLAAARARATAERPSPQDVVASWRRARAVRAGRPPLAVADLALDGRDLIRLGMKPGPRFGEILDALLAWVLEDPARNETSLLEERALHLAGGRARGDG